MDFSAITQTDLWWMPLMSGEHTLFFDELALTLTSGLTWIPLYLTLFFVTVKNNETMMQILLVVLAAGTCILFADGMADGIVKPMAMRLRPLNDPDVRPLLDVVPGVADKNYSFFSAHAANTMSLCVFFALLMRHWRLTAALVIWSLTNCWTRIYLSMHYPSDIIVGLLWGAVSGACVYLGYRYFYFKVTDKLHFISSQYTRTGYALADINLIVNILLLTVLYAIFKALILAQ
ncbi:MAG: phosphatase PAP2 family protein [Bacteroidales bacterium]|nr:phosphatase PAP2 family protein [Bacteroidales bacterium]MCM1147825.1 phosphatase PAP2 family protein [Bacteroidales bacterium]MCM1206473.1 phosphatase PAP2 family protein [Bacillota bacterium]MCM1510358.1 phosphatase PAP2 family protein [Clostridium sp.]